MRWFAWVVALCLMAAGVARPHAPLTLDRHDATVEDAADLATLAPRRPSSLSTDKREDRRFDLQVTPAVVVARPFALTIIATAPPHATWTAAPRWFARFARGPPVARAIASNPSVDHPYLLALRGEDLVPWPIPLRSPRLSVAAPRRSSARTVG
jgi:hypothetical protein